jgi:ATP-dependent helicase/DNAse subunit B
LNITIKEYEVSASTDITDASELQMVQKNEEVFSRVKKYLSENGLSPSALNTYVNCKMQFYYRYIISVKPEEELSETIEANVLGSAVHEVLEMLYKPFIGKNISATDVAKMQDSKRIEGLAKDFLSKEFDTKLLNGKNYLLYKVVLKLSLMFLKNEEAFLKDKNTIHLLELEQELNTEITIGDTSVKLKGLADRIDELNNVLRIVDYKTGKTGGVSLKDISNESLLKPEASKQFQLLMYAWLYNRVKKTSTIISGIYWLRNPSDYFDQLEINKDSIIRNEHLQEFESVLSNLIQEILSETTPFIMTEDEKRCKHCDFKNLCERAVV